METLKFITLKIRSQKFIEENFVTPQKFQPLKLSGHMICEDKRPFVH